MLKEYATKLREQRQYHQISQADYLQWVDNPITKQLREDLELLVLGASENIRADSQETAGLQAAKFNGVQDAVEFAIDWHPEYLEGE
jgi:hypothetical protein